LRARKKLGEILVEGGLLTRKQLEEALPFQKKSNLKLGQFLVREGIVSESQIVDIVSNQLRLGKYRSDKYTVDVPADYFPAQNPGQYGYSNIQNTAGWSFHSQDEKQGY
jgi:type IV pilus assembly protein PilB